MVCHSKLHRHVFTAVALMAGLAVAGCQESSSPEITQHADPSQADSALTDAQSASVAAPGAAIAAEQESPSSQRLTAVLAAQPEEIKFRFDARNPKETLQFFGVSPGMKVVEVDPGSGWYTGILAAYLGPDGTLVGADYPMDVYHLFDYYSEEELAAKTRWAQEWPGVVSARIGAEASIEAFSLGSMPASQEGTVDVFLFVRAVHNLHFYEDDGDHLTNALSEAYRALKPGGVAGVVQHMGPESHSDTWASGEYGYLKKSAVIQAFENAGFERDGETDVNENPLDQPTEDEYVWRLAPTSDEGEDPELAKRYAAIGESNRMTLRFKKPAEG